MNKQLEEFLHHLCTAPEESLLSTYHLIALRLVLIKCEQNLGAYPPQDWNMSQVFEAADRGLHEAYRLTAAEIEHGSDLEQSSKG